MSDDGYDVECSDLHGGSNILLRIVGRAEDHGMGDAAGEGGQYGHALLYGAVARFCTAINVGVAALRADAEAASCTRSICPCGSAARPAGSASSSHPPRTGGTRLATRWWPRPAR